MSMLTAAPQNRGAQKVLLFTLDTFIDGIGYDVVAERLDISVEQLIESLDGERELTMTELRLIAIAAGVTIQYSVAVSREIPEPAVVTEFDDLLRKVTPRAAA